MRFMRPIIIVGLGLAVAAALGVWIIGRAEATPEISAGTVSVLERARGASDVLPTRVLESPAAKFMVSTQTRLAQTAAGRKLYVTPGADGGFCLIVSDGEDTLASCGDHSMLRTSALYLSRPNALKREIDVFGLVGDGVTEANGVPVVGNTFAIIGSKSRELKISAGPSSVVIDLTSAQSP